MALSVVFRWLARSEQVMRPWRTTYWTVPPVLSDLIDKAWLVLSCLFVLKCLESFAVTKHLHYLHSSLISSRQRFFLLEIKTQSRKEAFIWTVPTKHVKICIELMRLSFLALGHKVRGFLSLKWTSACWPADLRIVHQTPAFRPAMANPGMKRRGNLNQGPYCVY